MERVLELFGTRDLYSVLGIEKDKAGNPKTLRTAYMKAALRTHPDKGPEREKEQRTQEFQVLTQIYGLMQDEELRKSYDETGEWPNEEELVINLTSTAWLDQGMILDFMKSYIGSEEEKEDVDKLYKEGRTEGRKVHVLDNLFFANILEDEGRVKGIIEELIGSGRMERITGTLDKKKREQMFNKAQREAKEAKELQGEMNVDVSDVDNLKIAMATRGKNRAGFFDALEAKYAAKGPKGKGTKRKRERTGSSSDTESEAESVVAEWEDEDEDNEMEME